MVAEKSNGMMVREHSTLKINDTKWAIRRRISKNSLSTEKGQTHYIEKLKIRLSNANPTKTRVNSCAPEGIVILALQVAPIVLLLNDKNII